MQHLLLKDKELEKAESLIIRLKADLVSAETRLKTVKKVLGIKFNYSLDI